MRTPDRGTVFKKRSDQLDISYLLYLFMHTFTRPWTSCLPNVKIYAIRFQSVVGLWWPLDICKLFFVCLFVILEKSRVCLSCERTTELWKAHRSTIKHLSHCFLYVVVVLFVQVIFGTDVIVRHQHIDFDPFERYGYFGTPVLYLFRFLPLLLLPHTIASALGLIFYNAFPEDVTLKESPLLAPFICFRIVTRGDYADLVRCNVMHNLNVCMDVGLKNLVVEVVTDKAIADLPKHAHVRQVVVPSTYRTSSGALFKARAMQYCLEDGVDNLGDNDWIVHLDEETIMTENAVRGIVNFVTDGKYHFGQGAITYASEEIVNWLTTLADSVRVADDFGRLRFQFRIFHRPLFGWKGSFLVSKASAERKITFDHGPAGSVSEDTTFGLIAASQGYLFGFIDGVMHEKSPFTIWDFLLQRKRWLQGMYLIVFNNKVPIRSKFIFCLLFYAWSTMTLCVLGVVLTPLFPVPGIPLLNHISLFIMATINYMFFFGAVKSFSLSRHGIVKFVLFLIGSLFVSSFNFFTETMVIVWGLVEDKRRFYVVQKEVKPRDPENGQWKIVRNSSDDSESDPASQSE